MNFNFKNNYQSIFLIILSLIIMFQFYQLMQKEEDETISEEPETYNETESIKDSVKPNIKVRKNKIKSKTKRVRFLEPEKKEVVSSNGIEKYGSPTDMYEDDGNRIIFWKFSQPNPWSTLYLNQTNDTFTFGLNHPISKTLLNEWNNIIPNLGFNDKDKHLMITTSDEESALAVINLVLNTVHEELSIKEIIESNLIDISVAKIRAHPLVKTKILEQIHEKISINKETIEPEDGMDLATGKLDIGAYGGNEFSFL